MMRQFTEISGEKETDFYLAPIEHVVSGWDLGGRRPADATFSGTRPPADPKGPFFVHFEISIFGVGLKKFSEDAFNAIVY